MSPLVGTRNGQKTAEPKDGADVGYLDKSTFVQTRGLVLDAHDAGDFGFLRVVVTERS